MKFKKKNSAGLITGVSCGFHDAAYTIIKDDEIGYATHSERHSHRKNDPNLHTNEFRLYSDAVVFYERPFLKNTRRFLAGQSWKKRTHKYDKYIPHHWSHAAASYYTRPFDEEPVCVVIDAIGEWDTASIWWMKKKVWSMKYPHSLGLFYSAITQGVGLNPMEDEYITMAMAAYGEPKYNMDHLYEQDLHRGIEQPFPKTEYIHIAASAQKFLEKKILEIMERARKYSAHLCYGGGVALNCVANSKFHHMFDKIWIMPNPGDAGASLGAAAAFVDHRLKWNGPYLGDNIERRVNPKEVVEHLLVHQMAGVANGRTEFGPRALGNRSLLGDPRDPSIKNRVNTFKNRQKYRPFAPAILEEFADEYFEGPMNEYMQYVAVAKHDYDTVTHVDGTARVQVVKKDCGSILRPILEEWYEQTKCPMLLNTSLNLKGHPMVNNIDDAEAFEKWYNIKVF